MFEKLLPFLIASALGLAIGIERERRPFKQRAMGVRTFILLGLLGALAGSIENTLVKAAITLFVAAAIVAGYLRTSLPGTRGHKSDLGLTTEIAAGTTFLLGFLTHRDPLLSSVLGLLVLIVLLSRTPLHRFSREQLKPDEIQAAVILFVLALGIMPLLPDKAIDPWDLLNIRRFVTIVVFIAGIQFAGYVAIRIFGGGIGLPLSGFFAGFISSTAAFLTLPSLVKKENTLTFSTVAAAIFAAVSTFVFLVVVVGFLSIDMMWAILPPILSAIGVGAIFAFVIAKRNSAINHFPVLKNPLSFWSALRLSLLLIAIFIAIGVVKRLIGVAGMQIVSFVSGLVELHGVSISATLLFGEGMVDKEVAKTSILLAALASMLSKLAITWIVIRGRYAVIVSIVMVAMISAFTVSWWLF